MRRKLLLSAAIAVAIGAPAFADTAPIVTPTPPSFDIDVDEPAAPAHAEPLAAIFDKPTPNLDALFAPTSNQFQQQARVLQDGSDNVAETDQTGGQQGLAHIRQEGDDNNATIAQSDGGTAVSFSTPKNVAILGQTGGGNTAAINQVNTVPGAPSNLADAHQFSDDNAPTNTNVVDIDQLNGIGLTARVVQGALDARANNNTATIVQNTPGSTTVFASAFVDQQSDGNTAQIVQSDNSENSATVVQEGFAFAASNAANIADVTQNGGLFSTVNLLQKNTGQGLSSDGIASNEAIIMQGGAFNTIASSQENDDNLLNLDQSGSFNNIQTQQTDFLGATSNSIIATQVGDNNDLSVRQLDAPSEAVIDQDGSSNEIVVEQIAFGENVLDGFTNTLDVRQRGTRNSINALQQDNSNAAIINQDGTDNLINLEQSAATDNGNNTANLRQANNLSDATINVVQDDSENNASVNQFGIGGFNLNVDIQQSGDALTNGGLGDANLVSVNQAGENNFTVISQEAVTDPSMFNPEPTNFLLLDQFGVNLLAQIEQVGAGNTVGSPTTGPVSQGGNGNVLQISQIGYNNSVTGNFGADGAQFGDDNYLLIVSEGDSNEVSFRQTGEGNIAAIAQDGTGNAASLTQATEWSTASIDQTGSFNTATVSQTFGDTQNAVAIQNGVGNSLTIVQ